MRSRNSYRLASALLSAGLLMASHALAEEEGGLQAAAQNPVGAMISLPIKNTVDFGAPDGTAYFLNIQPVIPITVGDWNLINRVIAPVVVHVPGLVGGLPSLPLGQPGGAVTGMGDWNYSMFVSPAKPGSVIWGIGPSITFPTATDGQLGSRKWSAGPTAVALAQPKPWTVGVITRQLWSFAGDSDRKEVSQFLLEPFVNYNLDKGWYLTTSPIITHNAEASSGERWRVPIGGGVGRVFSIGRQAVNAQAQGYYNVEKPDIAGDWGLRLQFQWLFPR